jgi:hypothetical protein
MLILSERFDNYNTKLEKELRSELSLKAGGHHTGVFRFAVGSLGGEHVEIKNVWDLKVKIGRVVR